MTSHIMPIPQFTLPQTWALQAGGTAATVLGHYGSQWLFGNSEPYIHTDDDDMPEDGYSVVITSEGRFGKRAKGQLGQRVPSRSEIEAHEHRAQYLQHKERMRGFKRRKGNADEGRSSDSRTITPESQDRADTDFLLSIGDVFDTNTIESGSSRSGRTTGTHRLVTHMCYKYLNCVTYQGTSDPGFQFSSPECVGWWDDVTDAAGSQVKSFMGLIAKGTSATTREGDCIKLKHITIRGVVCENTVETGATYVRLTLVQDRQQNEAVLTDDISDKVFDMDNKWGGTTQLTTSKTYLRKNSKRFNILSDKLYKLRS